MFYDTIRCNYPFPDGYKPKGIIPEFQSRSLKCNLDTYEITTDGELYKIIERSGSGIEKSVREKIVIQPKVYIKFYDEDREYIAYFNEGKIIRITLRRAILW